MLIFPLVVSTCQDCRPSFVPDLTPQKAGSWTSFRHFSFVADQFVDRSCAERVWPGSPHCPLVHPFSTALRSSRGRPANDEFCFQIVVRTFSPFQLQHPIQCLEGGRPHPLARNTDGGQRRACQESKGDVVDADNGDVFRNPRTRLFESAHGAQSYKVAAAEDRRELARRW